MIFRGETDKIMRNADDDDGSDGWEVMSRSRTAIASVWMWGTDLAAKKKGDITVTRYPESSLFIDGQTHHASTDDTHDRIWIMFHVSSYQVAPAHISITQIEVNIISLWIIL